MVHNVIIIGSGPSGYTAAIYLARAMLNPILITGVVFGGQLMTTTDIENFPGYPMGVEGPEMMGQLHSQAERFGTEYVVDDALSVDLSSKPYKITTSSGKQFLTRSIVISTGAKAIWLDAEGEKELRSKGISTCATCDGAFFKGEELIVVGGGDSAMEEAIFLTRYSPKVTIVHRRDVFRASKTMLERARSNPKIHFKTFCTVKKWLSDDGGNLKGALLQNTKDDTEDVLDCTGAFIAIGHKPASTFLNSQVEVDENGYVLHKKHTMTSVEGVFACGDVVDTRYRQAITAAGQGCQAAMDCTEWLENENKPNGGKIGEITLNEVFLRDFIEERDIDDE